MQPIGSHLRASFFGGKRVKNAKPDRSQAAREHLRGHPAARQGHEGLSEAVHGRGREQDQFHRVAADGVVCLEGAQPLPHAVGQAPRHIPQPRQRVTPEPVMNTQISNQYGHLPFCSQLYMHVCVKKWFVCVCSVGLKSEIQSSWLLSRRASPRRGACRR